MSPSQPPPPSLCPIGKALASSLDGSFDAALLLSSDENGIVLHNNLHALLLLGDSYENNDDDKTSDESSESNSSKSRKAFSRWIELPNGQSFRDVVAQLKQSNNNSKHTLSNVVGTLLTETLLNQSVTLNFAYIEPAYVTCYLKTDVAQLSVDEVSALQLDKDLVDGSFDPMFVIDDEGTILMTNEASTRAFGYTYAELLHHNISKLCGEGHGGSNHARYMKRYLETGQRRVIGRTRKTRATRKDGTEFPIELGVREINQSSGGTHQRLFCGYMKDMTIQEQHEKELQHRELLMQGMINSSYDPMFQINESGIITMVNNAAVSLFGWTREEFLGGNISMICGGIHAAAHGGYMKHYLETGEKKVIGRKRRVTAKRKDGTEFEVELGIQEVTCSDTNERVFCGFIRDLTKEMLSRRLLKKTQAETQGRFFGK